MKNHALAWTETVVLSNYERGKNRLSARETPSRDHEEQKCWLAQITQMGREIVRTESPSSQCYMLRQWTGLQAKNLLRKHASRPHFKPPESDHLLALLSKSLMVYPDIFKTTQFENCHIPQHHLPRSHTQANLALASKLLSSFSEALSVSMLVGRVGWTYFSSRVPSSNLSVISKCYLSYVQHLPTYFAGTALSSLWILL